MRTGADIFKALALGAKFVFCGRPWVYGMSINGAPFSSRLPASLSQPRADPHLGVCRWKRAGEAGVRHVMKAMLADFDILMNVAGFNSLEEITRDAVRHVPHASLGAAKL